MSRKYFKFKNFSVILDFNNYNISKQEIYAIKNAIDKTLEYHNIKNTEVSFNMTYPSIIKELNKDYRGIDKVTDVLSFPIDRNMLGDIVVCKKRCIKQANAYGNSYLGELSYLVVHSVLHLLGYDHMNYRDKRIMRKIEKEIIGEIEEL